MRWHDGSVSSYFSRHKTLQTHVFLVTRSQMHCFAFFKVESHLIIFHPYFYNLLMSFMCALPAHTGVCLFSRGTIGTSLSSSLKNTGPETRLLSHCPLLPSPMPGRHDGTQIPGCPCLLVRNTTLRIHLKNSSAASSSKYCLVLLHFIVGCYHQCNIIQHPQFTDEETSPECAVGRQVLEEISTKVPIFQTRRERVHRAPP